MTLFSARWRPAAAILLAAILLLWPALVNGGPFLFPDVTTYIRGADAGFAHLLGWHSDWTTFPRGAIDPAAGTDGPPSAPAAALLPDGEVVLAGRSVFYGAFLALSWRVGGLWPAAIVQALVTAMALQLSLGRLAQAAGGRMTDRRRLAVVALLTLATPLPFYVSFMMPDIFTALSLVALAVLLCCWPALTREETGFWAALLTASVLFHSATLLIVSLLLLLFAAALVWRRFRLPAGALLAAAACVGVGVAGEVAFSRAVAGMTGHAPVRPPFLTARVIADGPGRLLLDRRCPDDALLLCRYRDRLGSNSDVMLWSEAAGNGIFMALPAAERRLVARQEPGFVLNTAAAYPGSLLASSLASVGAQLAAFGMEDFSVPPGSSSPPRRPVPAGYAALLTDTAQATGTMPVRPTTVSTILLVALSLPLLGLAWTRPLAAGGGALRQAVVIVLLGIAINALLCGALSTPHTRYQMRLIWLIPMLACLIAAAYGSRRRGGAAASQG